MAVRADGNVTPELDHGKGRRQNRTGQDGVGVGVGGVWESTESSFYYVGCSCPLIAARCHADLIQGLTVDPRYFASPPGRLRHSTMFARGTGKLIYTRSGCIPAQFSNFTKYCSCNKTPVARTIRWTGERHSPAQTPRDMGALRVSCPSRFLMIHKPDYKT